MFKFIYFLFEIFDPIFFSSKKSPRYKNNKDNKKNCSEIQSFINKVVFHINIFLKIKRNSKIIFPKIFKMDFCMDLSRSYKYFELLPW